MTAGPGQPPGFGTPSGSQPGFSPPPASPAPPPQESAPSPGHATQPQPSAPAPAQWAPPAPGTVVVAPPPKGRAARPARRSRTRLVATALAGALVLVGILSALPLMPVGQAPLPNAASTPGQLETVAPSAQPGPTSTATTGGALGAPIGFQTGFGRGEVTVHSAVWTDTGEMAPPAGKRYLILDVTITCTSGEVPVDALLFLAVARDVRELPAFGPALESPLGGQVLTNGESARGQLGYSLAPGELSISLLDAELRPVAELRIPAP